MMRHLNRSAARMAAASMPVTSRAIFLRPSHSLSSSASSHHLHHTQRMRFVSTTLLTRSCISSLPKSSSVRCTPSAVAQRSFVRSSLLSAPARASPQAVKSKASTPAAVPPLVPKPVKSQQPAPINPAPRDGWLQFFVPPVSPQHPLSWKDKLGFLWREAATFGISSTVGGLIPATCTGVAIVLVPQTDAALLLFAFNGLSMPVAILTYLALLRLRAKRGWPFVQPPSPRIPSVEPPSLGRRILRGVAVVVVMCLFGVYVFAIYTVFPLIAPLGRERGMLIECSLDDQWLLAFTVGLIGPVGEELLFRGLLFARCASFLGVGPGILLSCALFGMGHGLVAVPALGMGALLAGIYAATGSLVPGSLLHIVQNSAVFINSRAYSPMNPLDDVFAAFTRKYSNPQVTAMVQSMQSALAALDGAKALTPHTSVFEAMDRGGKGYLDASEVAYVMSLAENQPKVFNATMGVVERRVGGSDQRLSDIQRNIDRMPADVALLQLPSAQFFPPSHHDSVVTPLRNAHPHLAIEGSSLPAHVLTPFIQRPGAGALIPIDRRVHQMQRDLLHRYYSLQWTAFFRAQFPSGRCTAKEFHALSAAQLTAADHSAVLSAVFNDSAQRQCPQSHPVSQLMMKHEAGRQSFGGVTAAPSATAAQAQ